MVSVRLCTAERATPLWQHAAACADAAAVHGFLRAHDPVTVMPVGIVADAAGLAGADALLPPCRKPPSASAVAGRRCPPACSPRPGPAHPGTRHERHQRLEPLDRPATHAATFPESRCHHGRSDLFSLRCSGGRPVRFAGRLLARAAAAPRRRGVARIPPVPDRRRPIVGEIRAATRAQDAGGQFHVHIVDTLEEALAGFEQYDPRGDVPAGFEIDDAALSPVELLVHAAALRFRIMDTVTQYTP